MIFLSLCWSVQWPCNVLFLLLMCNKAKHCRAIQGDWHCCLIRKAPYSITMSIDNKTPKGLIFSPVTLAFIILNKSLSFCLIVIWACNQTAPSFLAILAYSSQFLHSSSSFLFWHCHAVLGSAVFEFDFFAMICHKHSASCHFPCNGTKSFEKGHS